MCLGTARPLLRRCSMSQLPMLHHQNGHLDTNWVVLHPAAQDIPEGMAGGICLERVGVGM
jgi:hypothetical protein